MKKTNKAVIIMDMPGTCAGCPCCYQDGELPLGRFTYQKLYRCKLEGMVDFSDDDDIYLTDIMANGKPNWCPLQGMPEKKTAPFNTVNSMAYSEGYNACIDDILRRYPE